MSTRIDDMLYRLGALALLLAVSAGCSDGPVDAADGPLEHTFTFEESAEGWSGAFADYSVEKTAEDMGLVFDRRGLPEGVSREGMALYLSGRNESDDLFMFAKRELNGLEPNASYAITYDLEIASDAPSGCVGIGGAPGEAVVLKVGAAPTEPKVVVVDRFYRLSADKGNQSSAGDDTRVVGDVGNGSEQCSGTPYRMITRSNAGQPLVSKSDADGHLWVFVGTDSGFEGTTSLYYDTVRLTLERR